VVERRDRQVLTMMGGRDVGGFSGGPALKKMRCFWKKRAGNEREHESICAEKTKAMKTITPPGGGIKKERIARGNEHSPEGP